MPIKLGDQQTYPTMIRVFKTAQQKIEKNIELKIDQISQSISKLEKNLGYTPNPRIKFIQKKNGTFRRIICPDNEHKEILREIKNIITLIITYSGGWSLSGTQANRIYEHSHANIRSYSRPSLSSDIKRKLNLNDNINSARARWLSDSSISKKTYMVRIDLNRAYESVSIFQAINNFYNLPLCMPGLNSILDRLNPLKEFFIKMCGFENVLPIGYPTSSILFDITAYHIDEKIISVLKDKILGYFRYVDDIFFIIKEENINMLGLIKSLVEEEGFRINKKKIVVSEFKSGWKLLGYTITDSIRVPKKIIKKIKSLIKIYNRYHNEEIRCKLAGLLGAFFYKYRKEDALKQIEIRNYYTR